MTPEEKEAWLNEAIDLDDPYSVKWYHRDGTPAKTRGEGLGIMSDEARTDPNHPDYHYVAFTRAGTRFVSTVFLVIDHSYNESQPLIFESMAFDEGDWGGLGTDRYSTEAEALAGHAVMVRELLGKQAARRFEKFGSDPREER